MILLSKKRLVTMVRHWIQSDEKRSITLVQSTDRLKQQENMIEVCQENLFDVAGLITMGKRIFFTDFTPKEEAGDLIMLLRIEFLSPI